MSIGDFIKELGEYQTEPNVFNPWREIDLKYDLPNAAKRRRNNLKRYLEQRIPYAKYIFVGEALSYQGGRFSGVPMTSERMLANTYRFILRDAIFKSDLAFNQLRSSDKEKNLKQEVRKQYGFSDPTSTFMWSTLNELQLDPYKVILWNIFPFHPFHLDEGELNNRPIDDITTGIHFVEKLIYMNSRAKIIAIGNPANIALSYHYIPCFSLPNPSHGHTIAFKEGLKEIIEKN